MSNEERSIERGTRRGDRERVERGERLEGLRGGGEGKQARCRYHEIDYYEKKKSDRAPLGWSGGWHMPFGLF